MDVITRYLSTVCLIFLTLLAYLALAGRSEQVKQDVEATARALYAGDIDKVIKMTHPRVLELSGGEAAMRSGVQQAVAKMHQSGMKIESFQFPKPPEFFAGGAFEFAVVHTLTVISTANGQRADSLNFQLGVRDKGSKLWIFVEGSRLTAESAQKLFIGFPADFKFPSTYRKKL
ncbi:MAG: hypothetical protein SGJ17_01015 [Hyphomicrobiales bacterium]|nr:hypothetical protein [Hyphomicrobiales bacterium]